MSEITKHDPPMNTDSDMKMRLSRAFSATSARLGLVAGAAVSDIFSQLRQEAPHFAAAFKPELRMACWGLAGVAAAALGGLMLLLSLNVAAASYLTTTLSWPTALACLGGAWIVVGVLGVLIARQNLGRLLSSKPRE